MKDDDASAGIKVWTRAVVLAGISRSEDKEEERWVRVGFRDSERLKRAYLGGLDEEAWRKVKIWQGERWSKARATNY